MVWSARTRGRLHRGRALRRNVGGGADLTFSRARETRSTRCRRGGEDLRRRSGVRCRFDSAVARRSAHGSIARREYVPAIGVGAGALALLCRFDETLGSTGATVYLDLLTEAYERGIWLLATLGEGEPPVLTGVARLLDVAVDVADDSSSNRCATYCAPSRTSERARRRCVEQLRAGYFSWVTPKDPRLQSWCVHSGESLNSSVISSPAVHCRARSRP